MNFFDIQQLISEQNKVGMLYNEFLSVPTLSAGIYKLAAGAEDLQQPHTEDEIYYVIEGKALFRLEEEDRPVKGGSIIYVPANLVHRFHSIEEDLTVLVIFSPAEYTNKANS